MNKIIVSCAVLAAALVSAQSLDAKEFYQGKTINLVVGSSAGGGYDGYARFLARHWPGKIPGTPKFIVRNMPGAGSLKSTNYIYNIARKDGTEIAAIQNGIVFEPLFKALGKGKEAKFDPTKLSWIGAVTRETAVMVVWHKTPFKAFKDLKGQRVLTGASGVTTSYAVFPRLMNATMGTNIRVVTGYRGTSGIVLALERGEIHAMTGWGYGSLTSRKGQWLKDKKVRILVQFGKRRHPEMPNVPLGSELTTNKVNRDVLELISARQEIGRPYVAPPNVPAAQMKTLRAGFQGMMKDATFLKEAKRLRIEIDSSTAARALRVINQAFASPPDVVAKARKIMVSKKKRKNKK